jgi:hypothetical protein
MPQAAAIDRHVYRPCSHADSFILIERGGLEAISLNVAGILSSGTLP